MDLIVYYIENRLFNPVLYLVTILLVLRWMLLFAALLTAAPNPAERLSSFLKNTPQFPFLRQLHIIRAFAGITGWTPDEQPIIDVAPGIDNFMITTGYSAHGFCIGPVVGRLLAAWIVNQRRPVEFEPCRLDRFDTHGR
jgi:glycine/D-amino acid oxidase-like deaminating enzyme